MEEIAELMERLTSKDSAEAYSAFRLLEAESRESGRVYPYFEDFLRMLSDGSSYVRVRGLLLISANARWDTGARIDRNLDAILGHITDGKPSVARQFIQALPDMARGQPRLAPRIRDALRNADVGSYRDSMRPLVEKDIRAALDEMEKLAEEPGGG